MTPTKNINKKSSPWYDPILMHVIIPILSSLFKLMMHSCRIVRIEGVENEMPTQSDKRAIYCTWHQRLAYLFYYMRYSDILGMMSQSRDGDYIARVAKCFGFDNIRGSSSRGGKRALAEIIKKMKNGKSGGMACDGPLGPARISKIGTIMMAHRAQIPIIPASWSAEKCWIFNSWDRFMVPKPFSKVMIYFGEPIWIPKNEKIENYERYRKQLDDRLNEITRICDQEFGSERPWRKVKKEGTPEIGPLPNSDKSQG